MSAFAWRLLINVIGIGFSFCVLPGVNLSNFAGVFLATLLFGVVNSFLLPFFLLSKKQLNQIDHIFVFFGISCLLDGILLFVAKMAIKGFVVTGFINIIVMILLIAALNTVSSLLPFPARKKNG